MSNLQISYLDTDTKIEIGVDEAGRGCLLGRVYTASVILPRRNFDFSCIKDSKKFHSKKKITNVADYIKENCISWSVSYENEKTIDNLNILQATQSSMHKSIHECIEKLKDVDIDNVLLLIDGNYFNNYYHETSEPVQHITIEDGDNKYASIAAASILAKVERDNYINDLCNEYPYLTDNYNLQKNKGYATKDHRDGISKFGITKWHRRSFKTCK